LPIDLIIVLSEPMTRLQAVFRGTDDLQVRAGTDVGPFENLKAGHTITHQLQVVPARDGVFALTVTVLADDQSSSVARSYSVPVIVGDLPANAPTAPAPMAAAAGGS
jgi:hypothetical protein